MEIEIDYTKSAHENAGDYYNKAKKLAQKALGAAKAAEELEKELAKAEQNAVVDERRKVTMAKREWYEKFHWMRTSSNMLVIGGRDAHQNELVNSRHFDENDLFFHADIFGAGVFVLKEGAKADADARAEAAHFAACYSSAWKEGLRSIDVYAMRREQVSKSTQKGSLGTGSFMLKGEREWYRNVPLALVFFARDGAQNVAPKLTFERLGAGPGTAHVEVTQGNDKKSDAAKKIAKALGCEDLDRIMMELPAGSFHVLVRRDDHQSAIGP
jgi:predicted ribosome quality control (RQC) complex YloA/Tae2 family protein